MELSMQTTPLTFLRCVYHSIQTQEETAEPIVPDSEPDIDAVADCTANLILREKDLRQGSAIISGKVMGTILYLPEDGTHPGTSAVSCPFPSGWRIPPSPSTQCWRRICGSSPWTPGW